MFEPQASQYLQVANVNVFSSMNYADYAIFLLGKFRVMCVP